MSNGRLILAVDRASDDAADKYRMLPRYCHEIYNRGSLLTDHNSYLRNQDQLVSGMLNDLVAAAYSTGEPFPLVTKPELKEAARHRRRLVDWLILSRILAAALGFALWAFTPVGPFQKSMNSLAHLSDSPIGIGSLAARLGTVALAMGTAYVIIGVLPWKMLQNRALRKFFAARPHPEPAAPDQPVAEPAQGLTCATRPTAPSTTSADVHDPVAHLR